jgi:hypothetical protein
MTANVPRARWRCPVPDDRWDARRRRFLEARSRTLDGVDGTHLRERMSFNRCSRRPRIRCRIRPVLCALPSTKPGYASFPSRRTPRRLRRGDFSPMAAIFLRPADVRGRGFEHGVVDDAFLSVSWGFPFVVYMGGRRPFHASVAQTSPRMRRPYASTSDTLPSTGIS